MYPCVRAYSECTGIKALTAINLPFITKCLRQQTAGSFGKNCVLVIMDIMVTQSTKTTTVQKNEIAFSPGRVTGKILI